MTRATVARAALAGLAFLASVSCCVPAHADSIPAPYWSFEYDLTDSTLQDSNTPFHTFDATFDLGPGHLVIQIQDQGGIAHGAEARLASFTLERHYDIGGIFTDLTMSMLGDVHGTFVTAPAVAIEWSGPMRWQTTGTVSCDIGDLVCSLVGLELGTNEVNRIREVDVPDLHFPFGTSEYDILMGIGAADQPTWTLPADPSGSTKHLRVRGTETSRVFVPEPGAVLLVGLGLGGIARTRRRGCSLPLARREATKVPS